jgi:predicted SprT family Zn-dependent metalloprotease
MTAAERAAEINRVESEKSEARGAIFLKIVEDQAHWDSRGVRTGEELDHYLAQAEHYDLYKEVHGIRPRWIDYSRMTTAEIEAMTLALCEEAERDAPAAQDDAPLTHNPFRVLRR